MMSDWSVPPGETLREALEERGLAQRDLARSTGFSEKHISHIVNGKARISADAAIRLERALGISARFWVHRQADHDLHLAQRSRIERLIQPQPLGVLADRQLQGIEVDGVSRRRPDQQPAQDPAGEPHYPPGRGPVPSQ
jgi:addiction module HigA family antidote